MSPEADRLLGLAREMMSELDLEATHRRVLEAARELTGARYAALGIVDSGVGRLERLVTSGLDRKAITAIGPPPEGRGLLGEIIREPRTLRLARLAEHPRSYGFPGGHPPMASFLGTPVFVDGEVYANLYLTDEAPGRFEAADERAVELLMAWAGIAIAHARTYERERTRREELDQGAAELQAMLDISRALEGEVDEERVLALIAKRARALVDARSVVISIVDAGHEQLVARAAAGEVVPGLIGSSVRIATSLAGSVVRSGRATRVLPGDPWPFPIPPGFPTPSSALIVPLLFRGRVLGVIGAQDRRGDAPFTDADQDLLAAFATSAAVAVGTAQAAADQALRRSIAGAERERARWARELHDETLQELSALKLQLASARRESPSADLAEALAQVDRTATGLRRLITDLRPAALDLGVASAIEELAARHRQATGIPIRVAVGLAPATGRDRSDVELTIYRVVQEGLTNALRHAHPTEVRVAVQERQGTVTVVVEDDGAETPEAPNPSSFGLVGIRERVALHDGRVELESREGAGTRLVATLHTDTGRD